MGVSKRHVDAILFITDCLISSFEQLQHDDLLTAAITKKHISVIQNGLDLISLFSIDATGSRAGDILATDGTACNWAKAGDFHTYRLPQVMGDTLPQSSQGLLKEMGSLMMDLINSCPTSLAVVRRYKMIADTIDSLLQRDDSFFVEDELISDHLLTQDF